MTDQTTIEGIRAEIEALEAQLKDAKTTLRTLRGESSKTKAEPKLCRCGCGDMTRGGTFIAGHDAKLRSRLLTAIDQGDETALAELLAYPTLLHGASEESIRERLGSETRRKEAQVSAKVEREQAKPAKPSKRERVDPIQAQQGSKSDSVKRNGQAIRNAERAA